MSRPLDEQRVLQGLGHGSLHVPWSGDLVRRPGASDPNPVHSLGTGLLLLSHWRSVGRSGPGSVACAVRLPRARFCRIPAWCCSLLSSKLSKRSRTALTPTAGASTSSAPSSTRNESVSLDLVAKEGIDQLPGLAGEPGDHPDSQPLGKGQEVAIEAAAEQRLHPGRGEALEPLGPGLLEERQLAQAVKLAPVQLGDQEPVCRAEPGSHVIAVERHGQHLSILPEDHFCRVCARSKRHRKTRA